jgi:hypothetical protein
MKSENEALKALTEVGLRLEAVAAELIATRTAGVRELAASVQDWAKQLKQDLETESQAAAVAEKEMGRLYEADLALWAERQASALRRRAANEIDWENVAEETESLARSNRARSATGSRSSAPTN